MVSATKDKFGRLDYAFNNAGISGTPAPVHAMPLEVRWASNVPQTAVAADSAELPSILALCYGHLVQQQVLPASGVLHARKLCALCGRQGQHSNCGGIMPR
jgi:NAD(P)-dependent dehydrogenase (short-subunit alcohol dehydrogenase family)